jgi:deoxyribonuclease V
MAKSFSSRLGELPDVAGHLRQLLGQVPRGRVTTYRALAVALGDPIAARWVGHFLLHHDHDAACACHRVVRIDGQLGLYVSGGAAAKARRLAVEEVELAGGAVDLERYGFDRFSGDRPLERLTKWQEEVAAQVSLRGPRRPPRLVAGVDVSYPSESRGVGAYVLVDFPGGRVLWRTTVVQDIAFPYISTFLGFRELPIYLRLLDAARAAGRVADLLMVDGSGILHPRRAGIATQLGVTAPMPTIGVIKKLLCGQVDVANLGPEESRPVLDNDRAMGVAMRPTSRSRRVIFVSPGHRVNLARAELIVRRLLCGHRLPEPLYWADRLSRVAGQGGTP